MRNQPGRMTRYDQIQVLWRDACAVVVRDIVARAFGITPALILSRRRDREHITRARQVAMYLTHVVCSVSLAQVGIAFGRDRSTAGHACRKVEDMRDDEYTDIQLDLMAEAIKTRLDDIRIKDMQKEADSLTREKKSVVGGEDIEELPLIRTANGRLLEVKYFK